MTTTVIELVTSPGNGRVVCNLLADHIRAAPTDASTADVYTCICRDERRIIVLIAVWRSTGAAERFQIEVWPRLEVAVQPFLDMAPRMRAFDTQAVSAHDKTNVVSLLVRSEENIQVA